MREIKFRARAVANDKRANIKVGDFVFGSFIQSGVDAPCIVFDDGEQIEIDRKTLGQFTGLKDVNGADIYKGDIVQSKSGKHYWSYVVGSLPSFGCILWALMYENNLSECDILDVYTYQKQSITLGSRREFVNESMEIIGNKYENPELLTADD